HSLALAKAQEVAQRQAVRATPFQPTLAVDAFKVADQQHTEVASRRQRWTAKARRVVHGTLRLDERIETCRDQNSLQLVVEGVAEFPAGFGEPEKGVATVAADVAVGSAADLSLGYLAADVVFRAVGVQGDVWMSRQPREQAIEG